MKESLHHSLEHGIPYSDISTLYGEQRLHNLLSSVRSTGLNAHFDMYRRFRYDSREITTMSDEEINGNEKYIAYSDKRGKPLYGCWDPERPTTDVGIRGINPNYHETANQTTILHADEDTTDEFEQRHATESAQQAMFALSRLHRFVKQEIARPFLGQIAKIHGIDQREYLDHFFPSDKRHNSLTRAILYHDTLGEWHDLHQPIGSDGEKLFIKEHNDQSSYSINLYQTAPGLQYRLGRDWVDSVDGVSIFRGAGEDFLETPTKASLHRVVQKHKERALWAPGDLRACGIARLAIVMFLSPADEHARVVRPNSPETHPTQVAI